jgi:hypothetical protein
MAKLSRRGRALREFRWSMTQAGLFIVLGGAMCAAIAVAAALSASRLPLPEGWDAAPYIVAVPLYMAALWMAMSWSGALAWRARARTKEPPRFTVSFDNHEIVSSGEGRSDETVAWSDLTEIMILNEDAFPVGSQYWLLAGSDGNGVAIPSEAEGMQDLLGAMQERLSGFDNAAVVQAMGSLDGAFRVWKKPA